MSQTPSHLSPVKGDRRILGEKNANACLSPARTPTKQTLLNASSPKKLLPSPFPTQKRTIGQVHAEDAGLSLPGQKQRVQAPAAHNAASVPSTGDRDSRPELTSSTSDAMNLDVPEQTAPPKTNTTRDQLPQPSVPSDPETRKQFIQEKASLLRNRLQNAMRHVRDPQFDRRVSELDDHSRKYPRLSSSGSGSGTQLQQHLQQKYGGDETDKDAQDEPILSTPRQSRSGQEQREVVQFPDDDDETTPTQNNAIQRAEANASQRPASPTQMVLSSPTYNQAAQSGRFDDDRPRAREATVATSPSASQRGDGHASNGDGDAVDGLLKLMRTNTTTTGMGA